MVRISVLCQLNGGCMGCCGHDFSKDKIKETIIENTVEFKEHNPRSEKELVGFRDRYRAGHLCHGVCRNLIEEDGQLVCPLHPRRNKGKDLRKGHCDTSYFCNTVRQFSNWDWDRQNEFIHFIKKKKLNSIDFSLKMDNGELLEEFLCIFSSM